jgi:hypothetical protein
MHCRAIAGAGPRAGPNAHRAWSRVRFHLENAARRRRGACRSAQCARPPLHRVHRFGRAVPDRRVAVAARELRRMVVREDQQDVRRTKKQRRHPVNPVLFPAVGTVVNTGQQARLDDRRVQPQQ